MRINFQIFNNLITQRRADTHFKTENRSVINPFAFDSKDKIELSFTSAYCSPKNFEVKKIPNLYCPACGLIMLTEEQVKEYVADVSSKKGEELVAAIEKYEDESFITNKPPRNTNGLGVYRPQKKEIAQIYKKLALENPTKNLLELTQIEAQRRIDALIRQQMHVMDEISLYVEENFEDESSEKKSLTKKINKFIEQIEGTSEDVFSRKKFISALRATDIPEVAKNDIEEIASKMPTSKNDINSFFVKYSNKAKSAGEIASVFVQETLPTTEHLKPKARGGADNIANYICDCADCNSRKGDMYFLDWVKTKPGIEQRLQAYLNDIRIVIDDDELDSEYDTYIEKIVDTIETLTKGEIVLKVPEVTNPRKKAAIIAKRAKEVESYISENNKLIAQRNFIQQEINRLMEYPDFEVADRYRKVVEDTEQSDVVIGLQVQIEKLKEALTNLRKEVKTARGLARNKKGANQKEELQELIAAKEARIVTLGQEIKDLTQQLEDYRKQAVESGQDFILFTQKLKKLEARISVIRELKVAQTAQEEVSTQLAASIQKENVLLDEIAEYEKIVNECNALNEQIEKRSGRFKINTDDYNEYQEQKNILKEMQNMLDSKNFKKSTFNAGLARKGIEIAIATISKTVEELEGKDSVQYYVNAARARGASKKIETIRKKLEEIQEETKKIKEKLGEIEQEIKKQKEARAQVEGVDTQNTLEEITAIYDTLVRERQTINEIFKMTARRVRLEQLNALIQKNNFYLGKLENYEELTNSLYAEYKSEIDFGDFV